jgi:hypothetical protein
MFKKKSELDAAGKCSDLAKNMNRSCRNVEMIVERQERERKKMSHVPN